MKKNLDSSQFSFYLSDTYTGTVSSLILGGYDLKYAKEGSKDEDISWVNLATTKNDKYWSVDLGASISFGDSTIVPEAKK